MDATKLVDLIKISCWEIEITNFQFDVVVERVTFFAAARRTLRIKIIKILLQYPVTFFYLTLNRKLICL